MPTKLVHTPLSVSVNFPQTKYKNVSKPLIAAQYRIEGTIIGQTFYDVCLQNKLPYLKPVDDLLLGSDHLRR